MLTTIEVMLNDVPYPEDIPIQPSTPYVVYVSQTVVLYRSAMVGIDMHLSQMPHSCNMAGQQEFNKIEEVWKFAAEHCFAPVKN